MLELVKSVGLARDPDEFLHSALRGVTDLVPCMVASINEVVPAADRLAFWVEPASFRPPDGVSEALAERAGEHPLIPTRPRPGTVRRDGSVTSGPRTCSMPAPCIASSINRWVSSTRCR